MMIHDNLQAPLFQLTNQRGELISLRDFQGKWVVLYFYPKDNTSGCTTQACAFRDAKEDFSKLGAVIFGISKDTVNSHEKFHEAQKLAFDLLSDSQGNVCEAYGVWVQKSMYGRTYWGIERSTFLINPEGDIVRVWKKVKVPGHVSAVLTTLKEAMDA